MSEHLGEPSKQEIDSAITFIRRAIKNLSQDVRKDIAPQQVEDLNDGAIDFLNAALSRLGVDRYTE